LLKTHPSIKSADIYPRMRSVTDEDLKAIAGHILITTKSCIRKMGWWKNLLLNYKLLTS
jgi:photosystem II cytochrome c550